VTEMEAEIHKIRALVDRIRPDRVLLNTAVRPTAEPYAEPVPQERMRRLCESFGPNAEVIADFGGLPAGPTFAAADEELLAMLRRRPCRVADVAAGLSIHPDEALKHLADLVQRGLVREHFGREGHYFEAVRGA
jgi:wyosine [tRNA(Phe)-imidazoG37] synthetase (radical SAM superfamily)